MKYKIKRSLNFWTNFLIFKFLESRRFKKIKKQSVSVVYNNDYISNEVLAFGGYENDLQNTIFKFLKNFKNRFANGTCLDVGANIGTSSLNFSNYFKKVYGFEPDETTFRIYNINIKNKKNIYPFNFGLGNTNSTKKFYIDELNKGESSLKPEIKRNKIISNVEIKKLDDLKINFSGLSFIKVDIENGEKDFFKGAKKIINNFKPIIVFEYRKKKGLTNMNFPSVLDEYYFFEYLEKDKSENSFFKRRLYNFFDFFLNKTVKIRELDNLENKNYPLIIAIPEKDLHKIDLNRKLPFMIKVLNFLYSKIYEKFIFKLSTRSKNSFITHYPILVLMCRILKIKKIVEFGSGKNSTLNFSNKKIFPYTNQITSYEDNLIWYKKIKKLIKNKKINYHYTSKISKIIRRLDLEKFDLIFIDNSMDSLERIETIKNIGKKNLSKTIIVLHDFEYYPYREATKGFNFSYRFSALNPNTGVVWNNKKLNMDKLKKIEELIVTFDKKNSINSYNKFFSNKKFINKVNNLFIDGQK